MAHSKVVLYFDTQEDALLFTLAASSVLSEDGHSCTEKELTQVVGKIGKATRITTHGVLDSAGPGGEEGSSLSPERYTA